MFNKIDNIIKDSDYNPKFFSSELKVLKNMVIFHFNQDTDGLKININNKRHY